MHKQNPWLDSVFLCARLDRKTITSSGSLLPSCVISWCWRPRPRRKRRKHTGGNLFLADLHMLIIYCSGLHLRIWFKPIYLFGPVKHKEAQSLCVSVSCSFHVWMSYSLRHDLKVIYIEKQTASPCLCRKITLWDLRVSIAKCCVVVFYIIFELFSVIVRQQCFSW